MATTEQAWAAPNRHHSSNRQRFNGDMTKLGELIRLYRAVHAQSVRECANEIGIHHTTLNRYERFEHGLSAHTFMKILIWLLSPSVARRDQVVVDSSQQ